MKKPKFKIGDVVNTQSGGTGIVCAILDTDEVLDHALNQAAAKDIKDLMTELLGECNWFLPMYHLIWRDENDTWMVSTVDEKELSLDTTKTMMVHKDTEFLNKLTKLGIAIKHPSKDEDNEDQSK